MTIPTRAGQDQAAFAALMQRLGARDAPPALPEVREDPSVVTGYEVQRQYAEDLAAAQAQAGISELDKAKNILRIWRDASNRLADLWDDLVGRRRARMQWIEAQLPIGPGVPADASPADRAVLVGAFTAALDRARQMNREQQAAALADAVRFGDDSALRGLLTAAIDASAWDVVDAWASHHMPETGVLLTEWRKLSGLLAGHGGIDASWTTQALSLPKRPPEWFRLPQLVEATNRSIISANSSRARTAGSRAQPLIELSMQEFTPRVTG